MPMPLTALTVSVLQGASVDQLTTTLEVYSLATTVTTHVPEVTAIDIVRVITVDGVEQSRTVIATAYDQASADLIVQTLGTQTLED